MEQTTSARCGHQVEHCLTASRLAEDGDVVGIAAEHGNVVAHPLERCNLVEEAVVARHAIGRLCCQFWMGEETEHAEPVVDRDEHRAALSKNVAVIKRLRATAIGVIAAMDPDHHRKLATKPICVGRHPHV